jgi:LemA protein
MSGPVIVGALVALVVLWAILAYNSFVAARQKVDEGWSGIDVQLRRRHDLVPNLVETVRAYAEHERATLTAVTEARARAMAAHGPAEAQPAESRLTAALDGVRALGEAYPELRASENFLRLQGELSEIEDEIQAARRIFNSNVQAYNTRIQVFPNLLVARPFDFTPREFFQIEVPAQRSAPRVAA